MRTLDSAATAVGIRWRFCLLLQYIVICCLIGRNSDCHEDRSPVSITACFRWFFPTYSSFLFLNCLFIYFFFFYQYRSTHVYYIIYTYDILSVQKSLSSTHVYGYKFVYFRTLSIGGCPVGREENKR